MVIFENRIVKEVEKKIMETIMQKNGKSPWLEYIFIVIQNC